MGAIISGVMSWIQRSGIETARFREIAGDVKVVVRCTDKGAGGGSESMEQRNKFHRLTIESIDCERRSHVDTKIDGC
jgi:hypothetical protein